MDLLPAGIIGGLVTLALMVLVMWSANRRKPGAPPRTAAFNGAAMIAIATAATLAYLGAMAVYALGALAGDPAAPDWVFLALGIFGLALAAAAFDLFTRQIDWTETSLVFRSWRGAGECDWSDIVSVDYKFLGQYWRISFRGMKRGFALFEHMTGARDFLETAQRKGVPVKVWGKQTVP